ncbi:MAG: Ig-like domain-containing protein [Bifidobacteriaceae bacterium]|nr:Ig-like domain-containing protein [Bifidobacteriaceae bacterium]
MYTLDVYASIQGAKNIVVHYTAEDQALSHDLRDATVPPVPEKRYVTANFVTPPVSGGVFVLGDPVEYPGETSPQDNWDNPADQPDGSPVDHNPGVAFHPGVRVWDAGRHNPTENTPVRFTLTNAPSATCTATFTANGQKTISNQSSATGKYRTEVNATVPGSCVITAEIQLENGTWQAAEGSPKTLVWANVPYTGADFNVSTAVLVANGVDAGTITVHVWDQNNYPVINAANDIVGAGVDPNSGISVGAFTHNSAVPGEYTAPFTGTKDNLDPGWEIKVTLGSSLSATLVTGGNKYAKLKPGPAAEGNSWLIQPSSATTPLANGTDTWPVSAHLRDGSGNNVANGTKVTFHIPAGTSAGGQNGPANVDALTNGGLATIQVTSTNATWDNSPAYYVVTANITDTSVPNAPQIKAVKTVDTPAANPTRTDGEVRLEYENGPVSEATSWLIQPDPKKVLADGQTTLTVRVHARDKDGNDVKTGAIAFAVPANVTAVAGAAQVVGGAGGTSTIDVAIVNGYATVAYKTTTAADYVITAKTGNASILAVKNQAETATDGQQDGRVELTFEAKPPVAQYSWLIQPDNDTNKQANKSDFYTVQVHAQDEFGNDAVDGAEVVFSIPAGIWVDGVEGPRDVTRTTVNGYASIAASSSNATDDGDPAHHVIRAKIGGAGVNAVRNAAEAATPIRTNGEVWLEYQPVGWAQSESWLVQPSGSVMADGVETLTVKAHLRGEFQNNVIDGTAVQFYIPAGTKVGATSGPAYVTATTQGGYATIQVSSTVITWDKTPPYHVVTAQVGSTGIVAVRDAAESAPPLRSDGQVRLEYTSVPTPCAAESWLVEPTGSVEVGGPIQDVKAHVRDCNGNSVANGTVVTFTIPTGTSVGAQQGPSTTVTATTTNGVATIAVAATDATWDNTPPYHVVTAKAGNVSITAVKNVDTAAAQPVRTNGEAHLVFDNKPVSSAWLVQPSPNNKFANGSDTLTVKVHAKDDLGNDVKTGSVIFAVPANLTAVVNGSDVPGGTAGTTTSVPVVDGYATVLYKTTRAADYVITAKITSSVDILAVKNAAETANDGQQDGRVELVFDPMPVSNMWLIQPDNDPNVNANKVDSYEVRVRAEDDQGNAVANGTPVVFHIPAGTWVDGVEGPRDVNTTTTGGLASITVTASDATDDNTPAHHVITAKVEGQAVANVRNAAEASTPIRLNGEVWLEFQPEPATQDESWLVEPSGNAVANGTQTLIVKAHLRDGQKNNVADGTEVEFYIPTGTKVGATSGPAWVRVSTVGGYATIEVTSTVATWDKTPPYHVVTARVVNSFTIQTVRDQAEAAAPLRTDGQVHLEYRSDPTPCAAESWLVEPGGSVKVGTITQDVKAHVRDCNGNNMENGTVVTFSIPAGTSAGAQAGPSTTVTATTTNGVATIAVAATDATNNNTPPYHVVTAKAGSVSITAVKTVDTAAAQPVRNDGEAHLVFDPDDGVAGSSWLIEPAGSVEANGTEILTVKARIKDGLGNDVADGQQVIFTIPELTKVIVGGQTYTGPMPVPVTTVNGYASINVTSTTANDSDPATTVGPYYEVTATVGGGSINAVRNEQDSPVRNDGKAHVVFGSGPVVADTSWLVQPNGTATANGTSPQIVKVEARDANGNAAGTGTIVFTIPADVSVGATSGPNTIEVPVSAGSAQISVTSSLAAGSPYKVSAAVKNAGAITTVKTDANPAVVLTDRDHVKLTFVPGPVHPGNTVASLWVDPQNHRADGASAVDAYMIVQDADHNPIAGDTSGCTFELVYSGDQGPRFGNGSTGAKITTVNGQGDPTGADGKCSVQIFSYYEGGFPVKGTFGGVSSPGPDSARPKANFSNQPVSASESWFTVTRATTNRSPDKAIADNVDYYRVQVNTRDAAGHVLTNEPVDIYAQLLPGGPEVLVGAGIRSGTTVEPGVATYDFRTTVAGVYRITVKAAGNLIATEPHGTVTSVDVEFVADGVDWTKSSVDYSSGDALPDDIGLHFADVTLRDSHNNLVPSTSVFFTLETSLGHFVEDNGTNLGQGPLEQTSSLLGKAKALIKKSGPNAEDVTLKIWLNGTTGTPVASHVFSFVPGGPSPDRSTLQITPDPTVNSLVANGQAAYDAVVTVRDVNDIHLSGKPVTFDFDQAGVTVSPAGPYTTDANGQVKVKFTSTQAKTYTVNAGVGGGNARAEDQQIRFVAGPATALKSSLVTTGSSAYADGSDIHTATVTVRDAFDNLVADQNVFFAVDPGATDIIGPTLVGANPVKSDANGEAKVNINSKEPGSFAVNAYLGGSVDPAQLVSNSPQYVQFSAGEPDPSRSSRTVSPNTDDSPSTSVVVGGSYRIKVEVVSVLDILVDKANVRLSTPVGGPLVVTPQTNEDPQLTGDSRSGYYGTYYWDVTSDVSGNYSADVEVWAKGADGNYGWQKIGKSVALRFIGGPPVPNNSWLVEPAGTATANGTDALPVVAKLFDASNNPAASGQVTFHVPADVLVAGDPTPGPRNVVVSVVNGEAAISVVSKKANDTANPFYGVSADISAPTASVGALSTVKNPAGAVLAGRSGNARVVFTPDAADPSNSTLSIPTTATGGSPVGTRIADGTQTHTAQVEVRDSQNNLVGANAASVVFSYKYRDLDGHEVSGAWPAVPTNASGIAARDFTSLVATDWEISATIASVEVAQSPKSATFVHGPVSWQKTLDSFEVDSDTKPANGLAPAYARVKVQDAQGNPVPGESVVLRLLYPDSESGPKFNSATSGPMFTSAQSLANGMASANIFSVWEKMGVDVRAEYDNHLSAVKKVNFKSDPASTLTSRFRVDPLGTNTSTTKVVADGHDGYQVKVTLRNDANELLNGSSATVVVTPVDTRAGASATSQAVTTELNGVATLDFKTEYAGTWKVTVLIGAGEVPREDNPNLTPPEWTIVFVAGDPSADSSRLVSPTAAATANGADEQVVLAEVKDSKDNPVPGASVVFTFPTDVKAKVNGSLVSGPVTVATSDGTDGGVKGTARLVLVSTKTGVFDVTARIGANSITNGSPAKVEFRNTPLSLAGSEFVITTMPSTTTVAGVDSHTARVTLRDTSGNVFVASRNVSFSYRLENTATWTAGGTVSTDADGKAELSFTQPVAGTYQVRAEVVSGAVQGQVPDAQTTRPAVFVHGPADASHSAFTTSTGVVLSDNAKTHSATATVRDANDNLVEGAVVTFTLPTGGPAHFVTVGCSAYECPQTTSLVGSAQALIASPSPVEATVTAAVASVSIGSPRVVVFDTNGPSAPDSDWNITPTTPVTANGLAEFTAVVTVRDSSPTHLLVKDAEVSFSFSPVGAVTAPGVVTIVEAAPYLTGADGKVTVHFTSTNAGKYKANALIGTEAIPVADQLIEFVAGPISFDPSKTFLTPPAGTSRADGVEEQVVTATVRDANNNPVTDAFVRFAVPAGTSLVSGTNAEVAVDSNGEARLRLVSQVAGPYQVTAEAKKGSAGTYQGIVGGSPAAVNFVAGPVDLSHSVISKTPAGPRDATGLATDSYTVTVELKDSFDNPVRIANTPVAITLTPYTPDGLSVVPGIVPPVRSVSTDADGVASTVFATTTAGVWKATGGPASGDVVIGSPVSLVFEPTGANASTSLFEVSNNTVLANGTSPHSAWVLVRDVNGNAKAGVDVQFTISDVATDVEGPTLAPTTGSVTSCDFYDSNKPAWCDQHGKALVYITSKEPGTFDASATIGGTLVNGAPKQVSFDSGPPDASNSSYTVSPDASNPANWPEAVNNPADRYTVTVTVNSASQILVPNAPVRLYGLDPDLKIVQSGGAEGFTGVPGSGSYGTYTWDLYTAVAGTYTGVVQVATGTNQWTAIAPVQFTIGYKAGPPKADKSWLVEPAGTATANGSSQLPVVAKVFDAEDNPANSGVVTFHVPADVSVIGGPNPGAGPRDVAVPVANGEAGISVVSNKANTAAQPFYGVSANITAPAASVGAIQTVKDSSGTVLANRNGQARVVFQSGPVSGPNSVLTIPTAGTEKHVGGTEKHTAQVVVKDADDNAKAGEAVRFEWIIGTAQGPGTGSYTPVNAGVSDANGIATFDFAAPNNQAVWVWVKAFVGSPAVAVGPAQAPTIVGAEFLPGPFDPSTQASFETYGPTVLNDLVAQSWARVVVQDQYGNGIGGLPVTFTLPATQAGALGTPVFVDGNTPPTSKTITVTTCARNLTTVPDECKLGADYGQGVYTPGLAYVRVVSDYEGDFTVTGSVVQAGSTYDAGSGTVKFGSPTGTEGSFTVAQTDPAAPAVFANGVSSYTVTATVLGQTASGLKPASGACVAPNLPAHVTVKAPLPNSAGCGAGSFTTDLNGQAKFQIVTTQAGAALIGAKLNGVALPTEPNGNVYQREVVFTGWRPSALHSELISPDASAREDDPAGQTVLAVVRDDYGNLAACWNGNVQVTCDVEFEVPVQTWTGDNITRVVGPARVIAHTSLIDFSVPNPLIGSIAAHVTYFGAVGTHDITATIDGQPIMIADGVLAPSGAAKAHVTFTDGTPPGEPIVNPSNGGHVDGTVADDDLDDAAKNELTVVVKDEDGNVIATCPVKPDGTFDCPIVPKVPDGTELQVVIEDKAHNQTDPPVEIITDGIAPGQPIVDPSDGGHIGGSVADEDLEDAEDGLLVVVVTDEDGNVVATCPVNGDGTFDCPIVPRVPDGTDLIVVIEDPAGNQTHPPVEIITDGVAPGKPSVDESDGKHVTGEVTEADKGDAADGDLAVVITDDSGNVVATCPVLPNGTFDCPIVPAVPDGETIHVVITDPAGNGSHPVDKVVDAVPPGDPVINESNGTNVTGHVADEDLGDAAHGDLVVVITDEDGNVVTTCPVRPDGTFNCPINPRLPDGEEVTVAVVDKAGNANDSNIVVDGVAPGTPVLEPSRGDEVTGFVPADDLRDAAQGDLVVVVTDPSTGQELCRSQVRPDGTWSCSFDPALPDGTVVEVTVVDAANNVSEERRVTIDSTAPITPVPDPTAGETLSGLGEEQGNRITVTDDQGNVLCQATVGANRVWTCQLEPAAEVGDILTIIEEDAAHNTVNRPWRVGIPEIAVAKPTLCRGDRQAATGLNFQPGETVTAVTSGEVPVGSIRANSDGMAIFQWVIPEGTPRNVHTLTLRGPLSGVHTANFTVTCGGPPADIQPPPVKPVVLPFTGADGIVGLLGASFGLLLAGLFLMLAAKRRRRGEES